MNKLQPPPLHLDLTHVWVKLQITAFSRVLINKVQSIMDLSILPFKYPHIFLKILSYLPLESLYAVFDVCKHWEASFDENAKFIWKKIKEIRMQ